MFSKKKELKKTTASVNHSMLHVFQIEEGCQAGAVKKYFAISTFQKCVQARFIPRQSPAPSKRQTKHLCLF
uniref:Uncharacterized protein n=1 Tax=Anguilla anguilla TaxID=7936 RepID=A0A0E9W9X5_ANGAN